jgi:hypothetical protein
MSSTGIPTKVSNARLIRQLGLWGYKEDRVRGDLQILVGPNGEEVMVMREHIHQGNSIHQLRNVYDSVTQGDAARFWSRTERLTWVSVYPPAPKPAPRPAPKITELPPAPKITMLPLAPTQPTQIAAQQRGVARRVLEYMGADPNRSVSSKMVAAEFDDMDVRRAGNALTYLVQIGHIERVMRGYYRLSVSFRAQSLVHHQHTGPVGFVVNDPASTPENVPVDVPVVAVDVPESPEPIITASVIAVPDSRIVGGGTSAVSVVSSDPDGDDLDALLELVLPAGYAFQPSHLREMRRWQDATARLLAVLRGPS